MSAHSKEKLEQMLFDVVDVLQLHDSVVAEHGALATEPAELVRLVLEQKDKEIRWLKMGFKSIPDVNPFEKLRTHFANYVYSEGCSCCRNDEPHNDAMAEICKILSIPQYDDESGYNTSLFKTIS